MENTDNDHRGSPVNTYLVGGAVRDKMLGLLVIDRDWVVVGSTPDDMRVAGYKSVGKDFPVFLHPQTHEEYALARKERKVGPGYHGFDFDTGASVTLEEDLSRRDLTINAMAMSDSDELVDPFNGQEDLKQRLLRHVSPAFVEDPVRVLRVARFMARLAPLGFKVADETMILMRSMVDNGEIGNLVAERVWQELEGALKASSPRAFIETLRACDALSIILPELDKLFGVPQPAQWHPEIDSGIHTLMVLDQATKLSDTVDVRLAALLHDLGKGVTPEAEWPSHRHHDVRGADIIEVVAARLRIPKRLRDLSVLTARYHLRVHEALNLKPATLVKLMQALDVIRKPERYEHFLLACEADSRGRLGLEDRPLPELAFLREAADVFRKVDSAAIAANTENKAEIPEALRLARITAIRQWRKLREEGQVT